MLKIPGHGRGLVRCLWLAAAAILLLSAAASERAEALSLVNPGAVPTANYVADGFTTEVRGGHGGGGGFHGGGYRSGAAVYRGGGYRSAHVFRGGGYRYSGTRYGGYRFAHRHHHFHRHFYYGPSYYDYPYYSPLPALPGDLDLLRPAPRLSLPPLAPSPLLVRPETTAEMHRAPVRRPIGPRRKFVLSPSS